MNPSLENNTAGNWLVSLRDYDEMNWHTLFHEVIRIGSLAIPLPTKGETPSEIWIDLFDLLEADRPTQEAFQRAVMSFYDHIVARRSFKRDRAYFVELHWYFGRLKGAGTFELLFRHLNSGVFEKPGANGETLQMNLLTMLKDMAPSVDKQDFIRKYLQTKLAEAPAPALYKIAFSFYNKYFYHTHFGSLAWQYALIIQTEKDARVFVDAWRDYFYSYEGLYKWLSEYRDDWQDNNSLGFKYFRQQLAEHLNYETPGVKNRTDPYALLVLAILNNRPWLPAQLLRDLAHIARKKKGVFEDQIIDFLESFFDNEKVLAHVKRHEFGESQNRPSIYILYNDNTDTGNAVPFTYDLILNLDNTSRLKEMAKRFGLSVDHCKKITLSPEEADILDSAGLFSSPELPELTDRINQSWQSQISR